MLKVSPDILLNDIAQEEDGDTHKQNENCSVNRLPEVIEVCPNLFCVNHSLWFDVSLNCFNLHPRLGDPGSSLLCRVIFICCFL